MRRALLTATGVGAAVLFAVAPVQANGHNCRDYDTQAEAQAAFDADPSDPNALDRDDDGEACETLPGGAMGSGETGGTMGGGEEGGSTQMQGGTPSGGVDTGGGGTAGLESQGLLIGGAAAMLGGVVLYTVRRREV